MRTYTEYAHKDPAARQLVDDLPKIQGDPERYRKQMQAIGQRLGAVLIPALTNVEPNDICIVCTVEDADFLVRGLIESLEDAGFGNRIHLVCLWNDKIQGDGVSLSPIIRQYEEDFDRNKSIVVIVKAIISTACVVKTNLTRIISQTDPSRIFVAAPVMLDGAEGSLSLEFPSEISSKFEFIHFAMDSEKQGDNVVPGIGGSVYELLGLGNIKEKNRYVPAIVKERRKKLFGSVVAA